MTIHYKNEDGSLACGHVLFQERSLEVAESTNVETITCKSCIKSRSKIKIVEKYVMVSLKSIDKVIELGFSFDETGTTLNGTGAYNLHYVFSKHYHLLGSTITVEFLDEHHFKFSGKIFKRFLIDKVI